MCGPVNARVNINKMFAIPKGEQEISILFLMCHFSYLLTPPYEIIYAHFNENHYKNVRDIGLQGHYTNDISC